MRFPKATVASALNLLALICSAEASGTLRVYQDRVSGSAGQSVTLPVSYTAPVPGGYLRITWSRDGRDIVRYGGLWTRSLGSNRGCGQWMVVSGEFQGRAVLFPANASLLLRNVQARDSGVYELTISQRTWGEKGRLTLTVVPSTGNKTGNITQNAEGQSTRETDQAKIQTPVAANVQYVSLVLVLFFVVFIVKIHKVLDFIKEQSHRVIHEDRNHRVLESQTGHNVEGGYLAHQLYSIPCAHFASVLLPF